MKSQFAVQLLQQVASIPYDPKRSVLSQAGKAFLPVPLSNKRLMSAQTWKGRVCGLVFRNSEKQVQERIVKAWKVASATHRWGNIDLQFRERLHTELLHQRRVQPASKAQKTTNVGLSQFKTTVETAKAAYEANKYPKSLLREYQQSGWSKVRRLNLPQLKTAFKPVNESLRAFHDYLKRTKKFPGTDGQLQDRCRLIQDAQREKAGLERELNSITDSALRQDARKRLGQSLATKLSKLKDGQKWMFGGSYGVHSSALGMMRYALGKASADKVPEWLKPFLDKGSIPDPQAILEGIAYKALQQGLAQAGQAVGLVLEDVYKQGVPAQFRAGLAQVKLPNPKSYVEGVLHEAFDVLRGFSDQIQPSADTVDDFHPLFPDDTRSLPDWMAQPLNPKIKEAVEAGLQAGIIKDLSMLLPAGAVKHLIGVVVQSAYLVEDPASRRKFLSDIETSLTAQIKSGVDQGLGFLDKELDELVASAVDVLPQKLLTWTELDLIGFGAPYFMEFEKAVDGTYKVTLYPTGIALDHKWHQRDSKTSSVKWPLVLTGVRDDQLNNDFFYGLLFHAFEPKCDPQTTLKASEFYDLLSKLGRDWTGPRRELDRQRNDSGYLVEALLSETSTLPEIAEFERHIETLIGFCKGVYNPATGTIAVSSSSMADTLEKAVSRLGKEAKRLRKRKHISEDRFKRVQETRREILEAVNKYRDGKRTDFMATLRSKILGAEQHAVHHLQEAKVWLTWALGDEVGDLIDALAGPIPKKAPQVTVPPQIGRGWLKRTLQRVGYLTIISTLSHCFTILQWLRSTLAPLHMVRLIHRTMDRLTPQTVQNWYRAFLRVLSQKLAELTVRIVLRCLSSSIDLTKLKAYSRSGKALVTRLTQEAKGDRTLRFECRPKVFAYKPAAIQLDNLQPLDIHEKKAGVQSQHFLHSCFLPDEIGSAEALQDTLDIWTAEDSYTIATPGMLPHIYQRCLQRIALLPSPQQLNDPVWDRVNNPDEMLQKISALGRQLQVAVAAFPERSDEYVLAQYTILFIVEKLARRSPHVFLGDWEVNACNLIRFAKGAVIGHTPRLETRLRELFEYRFPDLDIEKLPSEEEIRTLADTALFARRDIQRSALADYLDWYEAEAGHDARIGKILCSGVKTPIARKWDQKRHCWVRYLKRQINDCDEAKGGLSLSFRLLRYHSLCAHFSLSGKDWIPPVITSDWHERIIKESDEMPVSPVKKMTTGLFRGWRASADSDPSQPETEDQSFCPELGRLQQILEEPVLQAYVARRKESDLVFGGASDALLERGVDPDLAQEFEAIFCHPSNQLHRVIAFVDRHPEGIWKDDPQRMIDFLHAMLFLNGELRHAVRESPELPQIINKVLGKLFEYYLKKDPAFCLSLADLALKSRQPEMAGQDLGWDGRLARLWLLDRPQLRDAMLKQKVLIYSDSAPSDTALKDLCVALVREGERCKDRPFEQLEDRFQERYRRWLPDLVDRLQDQTFRRRVCISVLRRMNVQCEAPPQVLWRDDHPLTLNWDDFEIDLANGTLCSKGEPVNDQLEMAKERAKTLGIPLDDLQMVKSGTYESDTYRIVLDKTKVQFFRKHNGKWYERLDLKEKPAGDVGRRLAQGSLWLEETPDSVKKLLVSTPLGPDLWRVKLEGAKYSILGHEQSDGSLLVPAAFEQWLEPLAPLRGFCPLSKISCYTDVSGKQLKRIVLDVEEPPLVFDVKEVDGKLRACLSGPLAGFWLAEQQSNAAMDGLGAALLLDNGHTKKILVAGHQWVTASLWRGCKEVELAPYMMRWLSDISIQSQPQVAGDLHLFDLDSRGRLLSDNPESLAYLLGLYILLNKPDLADEVAERLERACFEGDAPISQKVVEALFPLALVPQKLDKRTARLRHRLFAALEINRARFPEDKVRLKGSSALNRVYYLVLIASLLKDLSNIASGSDEVHRLKDYQEYFLYLRLMRLVRELQMVRMGGASESMAGWASEILQGIIASTGKGPDLYKRYRALRAKYGVQDSWTAWGTEFAINAWEAPPQLSSSLNMYNIGSQVVDTSGSLKQVLQQGMESLIPANLEELCLEDLANVMLPDIKEKVPLKFSDLTQREFLECFPTYYQMAMRGEYERLKGVLFAGGCGDVQTRRLIHYLKTIAENPLSRSLAWIGHLPSTEELLKALAREKELTSSVSIERDQDERVEDLRQFFKRLDAATRHAEVGADAAVAGVKFGAEWFINWLSPTKLGIVTNVAKGVEKIGSALLHTTQPDPIETPKSISLCYKATRPNLDDEDIFFDDWLTTLTQQTFRAVPGSSSQRLHYDVESLKELYITLGPLCSSLQGELEKEKTTLLRLVNEYPRRKGDTVTFEDLRSLLSKGDFGALQRTLPGAADSLLWELEEALLRYLLRQSRVMQMVRCKQLAQELITMPAGSAYNDKLERLLEQLEARRAYRPNDLPLDNLRQFVLFEAKKDTLIWPKQFEAIQKVLSELDDNGHSGVMLDLAPGMGKTTLIEPLLLAIRADGKRTQNLASPDQFARTNVDRIGELNRKIWDQISYVLTFSRSKQLSSEQLDALRVLFQGIREHGELLHLTQRNAQGLDLITVSLLHRLKTQGVFSGAGYIANQQAFFGLQWLQRVLRKEGGELNGEEAHQQFDFLQQLCYPEGSFARISDSHAAAAGKIVQLFDFMITITGEQLRKLTKEDYQKLVPRLSEACSRLDRWGPLNDFQRDELANFISGTLEQAPEWMAERSDFSDICMMSLVLERYLPRCACGKKINTDYGKGKGHSTVPYRGNNKPDKDSSIKDPIEHLVKSYLTHYANGLSADELRELILDLRQQAVAQAKEGCPSRQTPAAQKWNQMVFGDVGLFEVNLEQLTKELLENRCLIDYYVRRFAAPEIRYYPESSLADPYTWASEYQTQIHSTGTPHNSDIYPKKVELLLDPTSEQNAKRVLSDKTVGIESLTQSAPRAILKEQLANYFAPGSNYKAIIDGASLFTGIPPLEVAQTMLEHCRAHDDVRAVVFYITDENGQDRLVYITKDNLTDPQPIERCPYSVRERLTYFDQPHCYSADIPVEGYALVNIDKATKLFELIQWVFRIRGIARVQKVLSGQSSQLQAAAHKVCLVAPREDVKTIFKQQPPTIDLLVAYTKQQELEEGLRRNLPGYQRQLNDIVRSHVKDKYLQTDSLNRAVEVYADHDDAFITRQNYDPVYLRSRKQVDKPIAEVVKAMRKQAYAVINDSSSFDSREKQRIKQELKALPLPPLPKSAAVFTDTVNGEIMLDHIGETQSLQITEELSLHEEIDERLLNNFSKEWVSEYSEIDWPEEVTSEVESWLQSGDPLNPNIPSTSIWNKFYRRMSAGHSSKQPPPVYSLQTVIAHFARPSVQAIAKAFDSRLWASNNWIPTSVAAQVGTRAQRSLGDVLVHFDDQGKVRHMGCLSESDADAWKQRLRDNPSDKICVYNMPERLVIGSPISRKRLKRDDDFVMLETQLKFLNGDSHFTPRQTFHLEQWFAKHGPVPMKEAYQNILSSRSKAKYVDTVVSYICT